MTRSNVEVTAFTQEAVNAIVISVGGSLGVGVAGQVPVMNLSSDTEAYINDSAVTSNGDLKVLANTDDRLGSTKGGSDIGIIAGGLGIGLGGGVGGSVVVAAIAPTTKAHITNATTNASGTTQVEPTVWRRREVVRHHGRGRPLSGRGGVRHRHDHQARRRGLHRRHEPDQPG